MLSSVSSRCASLAVDSGVKSKMRCSPVEVSKVVVKLEESTYNLATLYQSSDLRRPSPQ